jgi:hypothetical protein
MEHSGGDPPSARVEASKVRPARGKSPLPLERGPSLPVRFGSRIVHRVVNKARDPLAGVFEV